MSWKFKRKTKIKTGRAWCYCLSGIQASCISEWAVPAIFLNLTLLHNKNNLWHKHKWNFQSTVLRISFLSTVSPDKTFIHLLLYIRDCDEDLYWIYRLLTCKVLERQLHSIKAIMRVSLTASTTRPISSLLGIYNCPIRITECIPLTVVRAIKTKNCCYFLIATYKIRLDSYHCSELVMK